MLNRRFGLTGLTFVTTSVVCHEQVDSIKQLAKLTHSKLEQNVTESTTHLIVCQSDTLLARRTKKYLLALLNGVWIVDFSWIKACLKYGACWEHSEEGFEIQGDTSSEGITKAPSRARRCNQGLLQDFYICLDTYVPFYEDYVQLLQKAGATLIKFEAIGNHRNSFIVASSGKMKGALSKRYQRIHVPIITHDWVDDSIAGYEAKPCSAYILEPSLPEHFTVSPNSAKSKEQATGEDKPKKKQQTKAFKKSGSAFQMSGDAAKETAEATGGHKASLEVPGTREVPATKSRHRKEVKGQLRRSARARARSTNHVTYSKLYQKSDPQGFKVKWLPQKGRAVFANREFKKGDFLLSYMGEFIDGQEGERREEIEETGFRYFFSWKGKKYCIDASQEPSQLQHGRLINHGRGPAVNSKMRIEEIEQKPELLLHATRNIGCHEEILYDYDAALPTDYLFPSPNYTPTIGEFEVVSVEDLKEGAGPGKETQLVAEEKQVSDSDKGTDQCKDDTGPEGDDKNRKVEEIPEDVNYPKSDTETIVDDSDADYIPDEHDDSDDSESARVEDSKEGTGPGKETQLVAEEKQVSDSDKGTDQCKDDTGSEGDERNREVEEIPEDVIYPKSDTATIVDDSDADYIPDEHDDSDDSESARVEDSKEGTGPGKETQLVAEKKHVSDSDKGIDQCKDVTGSEGDERNRKVEEIPEDLNYPESDTETIVDDSDADYIPDEHDDSDNSESDYMESSADYIPDENDDVEKLKGQRKQRGMAHEETKKQREQSQVYVMLTNNSPNARCYDKVAYCFFCSKPQKKLPQHLPQHENEPEVAKYLAEKSKKKKNMLLTTIRNKGNHKHNYETMEKGSGGLVVIYRPSYKASPDDYQPCVHCLGWLARSEMWKHRCLFKPKDTTDTKKKKRVTAVKNGRLLLPPVVGTKSTDVVHRILSGLRAGEEALCIKNDSLIIKLCQKLSLKLSHDEENFNHIRCKLREVARLILTYRSCSGKENATLASIIDPCLFDTVVEAVRKTAGFDEETHLFSIPSLALKLGHSLKKVAGILYSRAIKEGDDFVARNSKQFIELCENEWDEEVSTHALRTLYEKKRNNPKILPLTSDVVNLSKYVQNEAEQCLVSLEDPNSGDDEKATAWKGLNRLMLTHLIVFNRRRAGEVSKMTLDDLKEIKKGVDHMVEGQMDQMNKWEQDLIRYLWRVEVVGKRGRTVPILVTNFAKRCLDALFDNRDVGGVNPMNKYFFAVPQLDSTSHIRGSDTLRDHSTKCGAKCPALLRSTRLRKHIATMTQLMNLRENEMDVLVKYLGHDLNIHRKFYRLPDAAMQVARISKVLFAMDGKGGDPLKVIGNVKNLDDLQVRPDEDMPIPAEEVSSDEDEASDAETDHKLPNETNQATRGHKRKHEGVTGVETTKKILCTGKPHVNQAAKKRPWTTAEKVAVDKHLGRLLDKNKLPGKKDITACMNAEAALKSRTWRNVKDFCRNKLKWKK